MAWKVSLSVSAGAAASLKPDGLGLWFDLMAVWPGPVVAQDTNAPATSIADTITRRFRMVVSSW
jgi:hypothetical protein